MKRIYGFIFFISFFSGLVTAHPQITSVSINPLSPAFGEKVTVTVEYCAELYVDAKIAIAVSTQNTFVAPGTEGQIFVVSAAGIDAHKVYPSTPGVDLSYLAAAAPPFQSTSCTSCSGTGITKTAKYVITIPEREKFGGCSADRLYLHAAMRNFSLNDIDWAATDSCSGDGIDWMIPYPAPFFEIHSSAEGAPVANGDIIIFETYYKYAGSVLNINTVLPGAGKLAFEDAGPLDLIVSKPAKGLTSGTIQWTLPDLTGKRDISKDKVWMTAKLLMPPAGAGDVINYSATANMPSQGTKNSGTSVIVGSPVISLKKSQSISSAQSGDTVTYMLEYSVSGNSIKYFEPFDNKEGTYNFASPPPGWRLVLDYGSDYGTWKIENSCSEADLYMSPNSTVSENYASMLLDDGTDDADPSDEPDFFCLGEIHADVRIIQGSNPGQDAKVVLKHNGQTGASAATYSVLLSLDNTPGYAAIEKVSGGMTNYFGALSVNPGIVPGVWLKVKAEVGKLASDYQYRVKIWPRGDPEPAVWNITWLETGGATMTPTRCDGLGMYNSWRPGLGLQRASSQGSAHYDNFYSFGIPSSALDGVYVYDTLPGAISYSGCDNGCNYTAGRASWALGSLFNSTGTLKFWGRVNGYAEITNRASISSALPQFVADSNTVVLTGPPGTPTSTVTLTGTATPTITITSTAYETTTFTATRTVTQTETATPTFTQTMTFTNTQLPTLSYTPTPGGKYSILNNHITNGPVYAIAEDASGIYIGGNFSIVGPRTGRGVVWNTAGNFRETQWPEVAGGDIMDAIPDGAGGWYIGGSFTYVAGTDRKYIAHILANGSVDAVFNPDANSGVSTLCLDNLGNIYAGGSFSIIGGMTRNRIAKLDMVTGAANGVFNPNASSGVLKIVHDGSGNLYVGGDFTTIGGLSRIGLAKLNTTNGAAVAAFNANCNYSIYELALDGAGYIYAGGNFTLLGGQTRNYIAKLNTTDGTADAAFNPGANSSVRALELDGAGYIYVGGSYTTIGGQARNSISKLSVTNGAVDMGFNPGADIGINELSLDGAGSIYAAGSFSNIGGQLRNRLAKLNTADGSVDSDFNPGASASVSAIADDGNGRLYIGGSFSIIGGKERKNIAKLNPADGSLNESFDTPGGCNSAVWTIALDGAGGVYVGGFFTVVSGQNRKGIAKLNPADGSIDLSFNPNPSGFINTIIYDGKGSLYVGGSFDGIGGYARNNIAKINTAAGGADNIFNPDSGNSVSDLSYDGIGSLYLSGDFLAVGGVARTRAAKVNSVTGAVDLAFNPSPNSLLYKMVPDFGTGVFAAGNFTNIGGQPRNYIAKLNTTNGEADPVFIQGADNSTVAFSLINGTDLYTGGSFTTISGQPIKYLAKLNSQTGLADNSFDLKASAVANELLASSFYSRLYVGGSFSSLNRLSYHGFAIVHIVEGFPTFTFSPTPTSTKTFSPTPTITEDYTHTPTPTVTETAVNSPTYTRTQISTLLPTPVNTATPGGLYSVLEGVVTDGSVYSIKEDASGVYIGGSFTWVGPRTGNGIVWNIPGNTVETQWPQIASEDDEVNVSIPDGAGGWYIGGGFSHVAGVERPYLAHILSNGALDTVFNPSPNYDVYALCLDGNGNLFVGGDFNSIDGGGTSNKLAKISAVTGQIDAVFNGRANNTVRSLVIDGNGNLYAAGYFTGIGGMVRKSIAKLDVVNGDADPLFNTYSTGAWCYVYALALDGLGSIYVAGDFEGMSGLAGKNMAKLNAMYGNVDNNFNPNPNGAVRRMVLDGFGNIYAGGSFTSAGGLARNFLAKLNTTNGNAIASFDAEIAAPGTVSDMCLDGAGGLYAVGSIETAGGIPYNGAARFYTTTGAPDTGFKPDFNYSVRSISTDGQGRLFIGGMFTSVGGQKRPKVAKINHDGTLNALFDASCEFPGSIEDMELDGAGSIYISGAPMLIAGQTREGIAKLNTITGQLDPVFNPSCDGSVRSMELDGSGLLYAGGYFNNIGGQPRDYIAKINTTDGNADAAFNPGANAEVLKIISDGAGYIYAGGGFTLIGSQPRGYLAKINATNGVVDLGFNANANYYIYDLVLDGSGSLYAGGAFTSIGGIARSRISKINAASGIADSGFIANANNYVRSIFLDGLGGLYAGGEFTSVGGQARTYLAKMDAVSGTIDNVFNPFIDDIIYALCVSSYYPKLHVGGYFTTVENMPSSYYAAIYIMEGMPTATMSITLTPTATPTATLTPTATHTFTPTATVTQIVYSSVFDDFETGALSGDYAQADTANGSSITQWINGNSDAASGLRSGRADWISGPLGAWGVVFGLSSPYTGGNPFVTLNPTNLKIWLKGPAGVQVSVQVLEAGSGALPHAGADGENWARIVVLPNTGWNQFVLAPGVFNKNVFSGNQTGNNVFDLNSIISIGLNIAGNQGAGIVYVDDIAVSGELATPTVTMTVSQTETHTVTESVTTTFTMTPTVTATVTQTATGTATQTVTKTVTETTTPTYTGTPTVTGTVTQTVTSTVTGTATETTTETVTPTMTAANTQTATGTVTGTITGTATATVSETVTPTMTQTATPSITETITFTSTASATQSVTETVTHTVTRTASDTATETATPTITLTATDSPTESATSTATPTYTATATPSNTSTPTDTATNTATRTNTPTFTNTATPTNTPTETGTLTPTPSWTITNTATPTYTITQSVTITNTPTITATYTITPTPVGAAALDSNIVNPDMGESLKIGVLVQNAGVPVEVKVYNLSGELLRKLEFISYAAGWNETWWDVKNEAGKTAGRGIYFIHINAGGKKEIKRVFVTKIQ